MPLSEREFRQLLTAVGAMEKENVSPFGVIVKLEPFMEMLCQFAEPRWRRVNESTSKQWRWRYEVIGDDGTKGGGDAAES